MSLLDVAELTLDDLESLDELESLEDSPIAAEIADAEEPRGFLFNSFAS